jgi:hypothetical protein
MLGHSRSKNGVASLAYVPGMPFRHARSSLNEMAGTSPAMTTFLRCLFIYYRPAAAVTDCAV